MRSSPSLTFKVATEDWEFEAIHQLNYQTFVEEIPQHQANPEQRLVDKFHEENIYLICLDGRELAGMIALRGRRPFSLDQKLPDLDRYLPAGRRVCEVRLLAVGKDYRHSVVLPGLLGLLEKYGRERNYDTAVISGTTTQLKLYQHLGFVPFGPLVGSGDAVFQPMILTYESFKSNAGPGLSAWRDPGVKGVPVNFLPGPVAMHPSVLHAFSQSPVSHRSKAFLADFERTRRSLCNLVHAAQVEIMLGSGTLANDAIAGQISLLDRRGIILTNGEFGERLVDQARRFRLDFNLLTKEWGDSFSIEEVQALLSRHPAAGWIWMVHCETSTGVLNDIAALKAICAQKNIRLCLDCVSTIGTIPVDLDGVYLASGVSGKGLGSLAGLAMVFYDHALAAAPHRLPRYLDLGYYAEHQGIPFTHSSNLLRALQVALDYRRKAGSFGKKHQMSEWLRGELLRRGFHIVASRVPTSPAVVTVELEQPGSSERVGRMLEESGFQLSYRSEYLCRRNWIQICLMGECKRRDLNRMLEALTALCGAGSVAREIRHSSLIGA